MIANLNKCCWNVLEKLPCPFFLLDTQGNVIKATKEANRLISARLGSLVNERDAFLKLFDDEAKKLILSDINKTIELKIPFRIEALHFRDYSDRVAIDIELFTFPEADSSNTVLAIITDATERVQAYRHMMQSQLNYKLFLDNSPDCIFVWNQEYSCVYANNAARIFLKMRDEEVLGKNAKALFEDKGDYFVSTIENVFKTSSPFYGSIEKLSIKGVTYWMEPGALPIMDNNGKTIYVLSILKDFTEKVQAQKKVAYAAKLETIGKLTNSIIHDLNNQLGGIMEATDLLAKIDKPGREEQAKYMDIITKSVNRAKELVSALLNYGKQADEANVIVDIHIIINEVISMLEMLMPASNIAIHQMFYAKPSTVYGNAGQLQNAILNLALNARDAMPNGGELSFSTSSVILTEDFCKNHHISLQAGPYIQISVKDTGKGIPPEHLNKIFEPFFTTKGKHGTGIGLTSVKDTIERYKGTITVESFPGKGADFKIYLPIAMEDGQTIYPTTQQQRFIAKIMIIEDEVLIRNLTVNMLKHLGCEAIVFETCQEAIENYKQNFHSIDAVLLDLIMPGTDGLTLLKELYKINPNVKAIVMSGYLPDISREELQKIGCKNFLKKPFKINELANALKETL